MSSSSKDTHLRSSHWGIVLNTTSMGPQRSSSQMRYDSHSLPPSSSIASQSTRRHSSKTTDKKKSSVKSSVRSTTSSSKPFKCSICHHSFERNGHLTTHVNAVHLQKQPWVCDYPGCGQSFGHRSSLSRHKKGIHKME